jgi:hypothetical protein
MAEITKPADINKIWAAAGDVLAPSDSKIATGWQVEIPARQYFNYIDNKQDQAIAHINQHGIAVWDNTTEYQYSLSGTKSICMGSDGIIYRAKQVSINQNPVTDTTDTYWEVAFASAADFYTSTQSDARYLQKSANLSDLTNTAVARTNLSVYSQAQTYTKTEVDAKTTVASTAQAQAQSSDTVLISALKLAQSFQGANQSLTNPGFQKFPGGLIVQFGLTTTSASEDILVTFPKEFTTIFSVVATSDVPVGGDPALYAVAQTSSVATTNFRLRASVNGDSNPVGQRISGQVRWVAIGI